jgi:hypothetical protein
MEPEETTPKSVSNEISKSDTTIQIHYEKNQMYRTIFSDGAIGGITPTNTVFLSFYGTRNAIPKSMIYDVTEGGVLGDGKVSEDSKSGFIREIEVGVYMTKQSAKDLFDFLKNILDDDEE